MTNSNRVRSSRPARALARAFDRAFTLVELMVVVGIIAVLIAVLIPVIASVRTKAYDADTQNWVRQLAGAIERYQSDHRAYPGPLADSQVYTLPIAYVPTPFAGFTASTSADFDAGLAINQVTGSENLVLGLLGGLSVRTTDNFLIYDPAQIGLGPLTLNAQNPKRGTPYLEAINLSWRQGNNGKTGRFQDGTGPANDSIIPEFVDKYPTGEMPILYLRARRGVPAINTGTSATNNSVITYSAPGARVGTYDLSQIIGYTSTPIGEGKKIKGGDYINSGSISFPDRPHGLQSVTLNTTTQNPPPAGKTYTYPFDAFAYFESPQSPNNARNKDSYILISAGPDRTYGTRDDIVNFGTVGE